jgi:DNA-binding NarL/FixJ family response regulator
MSVSSPLALAEPQLTCLSVHVASEDVTVRSRLVDLAEGFGATIAPAETATVLVCFCKSLREVEANAVRALRAVNREAPILVVTRASDAVRMRLALEAGASGLILEEDLQAALEPALGAVLAGQLCLPPVYRRQLAKPTFTTREKQILGLVVLGLSNGEISRKLYLAESTIKSHLSSAFNKLGVRSRNEATAMILDPASGLGPGILRVTETLGPVDR